jgi:hypothetical protein
MVMQLKLLKVVVTMLLLLGFQPSDAALVSPIVNDYGNVFPTLTEVNLNNFRTGDPAPWYVSFNLLTTADVKLGTLSYSPFSATAIRLVTIDGSNVAFGTDTFINPFISPIDNLVVADALSAGKYALEVSGSGDRRDVDFTSRLQVSQVPIPGAVWLLGSGLIAIVALKRRFPR